MILGFDWVSYVLTSAPFFFQNFAGLIQRRVGDRDHVGS